MFKSILYIIFLLGIISFGNSICFAENSMADYYREILQNGKFYLKYTYKPCDDKGRFIKVPIIGDFETRRYIYSYDDIRVGTDDWNGKLAGNTKKYAKPFRYMDGKYYYIGGYQEKKGIMSILPGINTLGKNYKSLKAVMMSGEELSTFDINKIDTKNKNSKWIKGMYSAYDVLPLPEELSVFYDDPLKHNNYDVEIPQFVESSVKTIKGKEYNCDRYITVYTDEAGNYIDEIAYDLLYLDNRLAMSQKFSIKNGEIMKSQIVYEDFSTNVTKKDVGNLLPIIVYRIGGDDMEALISGQNEILVETIDATEDEND